MASFFSDLLRRRKYGEPVIIVSGLPRSGTSMMMKMLEAGGVSIMTDAIRQADVDNPKGYYEYERVKHLEKETDKSYVREARGKALKVISFLLKDLPDDNYYRVIFMRRDLDEVIASQNKMLDRRGEESIEERETMAEAYRNHLAGSEDPRPQAAELRDARVPLRRGGEEPAGGGARGEHVSRGRARRGGDDRRDRRGALPEPREVATAPVRPPASPRRSPARAPGSCGGAPARR